MGRMNTYAGHRFDPMYMTPEDVDIRDIAHALSLMCRGGGHLRYFYSVAQHCINCADEARARGWSRRLQLACLLHDASEAYISDIIRPVKVYLDNYLEIEASIMDGIWRHFGLSDLSESEHAAWKQIDDEMLLYEQHFLIGDSGNFAGTANFIKDQQYDFFWSAIDRKTRIAKWEYSARDSVVFKQAWWTFQKLAEKNTPFNITLLTIDAHGPNGFYSPEEPAYPYPSPYSRLFNAMYASDHALGDFIKNIKNHPKYKDTCIVITCDHLAHYYTACTEVLQQSPRRRLLFLIDNSSVKSWKADVPALTFDIAPTILDAMGVKHNYRFPLGESLYQNPDPRRLNYTKEQERVLYFYVLLKNENRNLNFPLEVSVHINPFPLLQINSHRLPLLIGDANDTPRDGEILVVRLSRKNEPIRWRTHYFKSFSSFHFFLNSKPGDIIFLGKTGTERLAGMELQSEPQTYFLGSIIHGKKQMVSDKTISNLKLHCR